MTPEVSDLIMGITDGAMRKGLKMPSYRDKSHDKENERKTRRAQNKRYYKRLSANNENSKSRWSIHDIELVLKHEQPDRVLSEQLGRSVKAIQTIRGVYKDRNIEDLKSLE